MAMYHGKFIYSGFTMPFYKRMLNRKLTMKVRNNFHIIFYFIWGLFEGLAVLYYFNPHYEKRIEYMKNMISKYILPSIFLDLVGLVEYWVSTHFHSSFSSISSPCGPGGSNLAGLPFILT